MIELSSGGRGRERESKRDGGRVAPKRGGERTVHNVNENVLDFPTKAIPGKNTVVLKLS